MAGTFTEPNHNLSKKSTQRRKPKEPFKHIDTIYLINLDKEPYHTMQLSSVYLCLLAVGSVSGLVTTKGTNNSVVDDKPVRTSGTLEARADYLGPEISAACVSIIEYFYPL